MILVALLSGGLDSTVALSLALAGVEAGNPRDALALTIDYGQRSAPSEVRASRGIAARLAIEHRVLELPFLEEIAGGPLLARSLEPLPRPGRSGIEPGAEAARKCAREVWIPNRNGLFLAIAASFADARGGGEIVVGFNREEAETFPDNSIAFLDAFNAALALGTREKVAVISPTASLDKTGIVRAGFECDAPLDLVHSCYEDRDPPCGVCESCERMRRALERSGRLEDFVRLRGWEGFPSA